MNNEDAESEAKRQLVERLTVLILSTPDWPHNYTTTRNKAEWLIAEAGRLGWEIAVTQK